MEEDQEIIEKRLLSSGVKPDVLGGIAARSALRVLPLLVLYSETEHKFNFPIVAFGYWPESERKFYLLSLMRAQGLTLFLTGGNFAASEIFSAYAEVLGGIQTAFDLARDDAASACGVAKSQTNSIASYARGSAFLSSNYLIYKVIESACSSLLAVDRRYGYLWQTAFSTKRVAHFSTNAAKVFAEAVVAAKEYVAIHNFNSERMEAINTASLVAAHAAKRFARCAEYASDAAIAIGETADVVMLIDAARGASNAFDVVASEAGAANIGNFSAAVPVAMSAAELYEQARVAVLSLSAVINIDLYVDVSSKDYELAELVWRDDFVNDAVTKVISGAESMVSALASVAADTENYNSIQAEFDIFYQSHSKLKENLYSVASIFNSAIEAGLHVCNGFADHEKILEELSVFGKDEFDQEMYSLTLATIEYADSACRSDIAAYSSHNTSGIKTLFRQSLLADIDFIGNSTLSQLLAQNIWLLKKADTDSVNENINNQINFLDAITAWEKLWLVFKRDALALGSEFKPWLDFYDDIFLGKDMDMQRLEKLLMAAFNPNLKV